MCSPRSTCSRGPEIFRLRQILLNLTLRLREAYVSRGQHAGQVAHVLAETFGPLRAAAATLIGAGREARFGFRRGLRGGRVLVRCPPARVPPPA